MKLEKPIREVIIKESFISIGAHPKPVLQLDKIAIATLIKYLGGTDKEIVEGSTGRTYDQADKT